VTHLITIWNRVSRNANQLQAEPVCYSVANANVESVRARLDSNDDQFYTITDMGDVEPISRGGLL